MGLERGEQLTPRPGRFTLGNDPLPIVQEAGLVPELLQTGAKTLKLRNTWVLFGHIMIQICVA